MTMVFGIGLSKTATTSLHRALELLGLRSVHYPDPARMLVGDFGCLDGYDAASDVSATVCFRALDLVFPDSRFVLTVREPEAWHRSAARAFPAALMRSRYTGTAEERVFQLAYGGARWYEREAFEAARVRHEDAVRAHFADRPERLLVVDFTAGAGWEALCGLLQVPVPAAPFPCENRAVAADST